MRRQVFADTSDWVALIDKSDALHQAAQFAFIEIKDAQILTTEVMPHAGKSFYLVDVILEQ